MIHVGIDFDSVLPIAITIDGKTISRTTVDMTLEEARAIALILADAVQAVDANVKDNKQ